ncbi:hypothetical protein QBC35DRAFT_520782 [Podospora australis]|uniref:MYND-type domain-containing protein n=1 Tax=Podospora australis TaxID=1536484 RepID=A0AAN7AJY9_9PEZI|nr:hypothetical protein QBC35DRAFT_520782 [Podospora australis]
MAPPDFTSNKTFRTFRTLPSSTSLPPSTSPPSTSSSASPLSTSSASSSSPHASPEETYYLLAQIKENMSITKPTLILEDLSSSTFALVWEDSPPSSSPNFNEFFKARNIKKGNCILIPNAVRSDPPPLTEQEIQEGKPPKQGCVKLKGNGDELKVFPGTLEKVVGVGQHWAEDMADTSRCWECGATERKGGDDKKLMNCTGCGGVRYCSKECQVKGWTEGGHKTVCKVIKAFRDIWP